MKTMIYYITQIIKIYQQKLWLLNEFLLVKVSSLNKFCHKFKNKQVWLPDQCKVFKSK